MSFVREISDNPDVAAWSAGFGLAAVATAEIARLATLADTAKHITAGTIASFYIDNEPYSAIAIFLLGAGIWWWMNAKKSDKWPDHPF